MENLQDALEKINYGSSSEFTEKRLLDDVKNIMPDCYQIECWDCDEYNTGLTSSVVDWISRYVEEGYNKIQYGEWCTDSCDVYYFFVAVKKD